MGRNLATANNVEIIVKQMLLYENYFLSGNQCNCLFHRIDLGIWALFSISSNVLKDQPSIYLDKDL